MSELWKQCAGWLLRLEVLPDNHRVVWPDSTIQDIAYTLRDGVLLCHVANALDPVAVDMRAVNQRPQMAQFLCLKNIRIFLNCLPAAFGLKETELFQPSHLYDYTDFARVLHTLSKLSHCSKAKARGIAGFPSQSGGAGRLSEPSHDEAQIYRTLEEIVDEDNYREFYYRHHGGAGHSSSAGGKYGALGIGLGGGGDGGDGVRGAAGGGSPRRQYYTAAEQEEVIYEDLCSFKSKSSLQLQQQLNFKLTEKRDYCIKELVETEGKYVDVLNMLRKNFIRTITSIKDTEKKIVFMNIKDLGETHAAFYQDILECVTGKSRKKIGEIFLEFKERFLKYGEYCASLPRAQEVLSALQAKDDAVREEVSRCELAVNDGRFRLTDLLTVPMQRVLKYHLLLGQLMGHTATSHEEYHAIQQAYEAMLDVSEYINEVKRDSEQLAIIRETQKSITDWNMPNGVELKDYGRLRKDSELKVQCHGDSGAVSTLAGGVIAGGGGGGGSNGGVGGGSGGGGGGSASGKTKIRYVFVFDKVMLMCKETRGNHFSYKDSLKLADYKVQEISGAAAIAVAAAAGASTSSTLGHARRLTQGISNRSSSDSRWAFPFLLVHVKNLHAYTMFARTEDDKNKWVAAIREALQSVHPPQRAQSSHDVAMHTFERPVSCDYCHKLLKGLFFQGYRCDKCGRAMHRDCIALLSKCGPPSATPPRLPPRPPSMQLPVPAANAIANRFSSCSIDEGPATPMGINRQSSGNLFGSLPPPILPMAPPPPTPSTGAFPLVMQPLSNGSNPDYINTKMEDHSWFVGDMDRESANTMLDEFPLGTFLVRCRVHQTNGEKLGYALSLKTDSDVKHMKICTTGGGGGGNVTDIGGGIGGGSLFFLSDTRKFRSVVELISWFSRNSLKESFSGLDTTLRFSVGELHLVEAVFDFTPSAAGGGGGDKSNMLQLRAGDVVTVIDKAGDTQGWWKAYNGFRVGFIPKDFVRERRPPGDGAGEKKDSTDSGCPTNTTTTTVDTESKPGSIDETANNPSEQQQEQKNEEERIA